MATSPLGRVYSNQICGPRRQTVHQGGRCVAKAYITASWQRGRDQPAVLNQRIIRGCDRVGTVTYSDQFARSDQPRHTVVRIALRPERPRQPHVVAYGHRASTAHGRRSWEGVAESVDSASAHPQSGALDADLLLNLAFAAEYSAVHPRISSGSRVRRPGRHVSAGGRQGQETKVRW